MGPSQNNNGLVGRFIDFISETICTMPVKMVGIGRAWLQTQQGFNGLALHYTPCCFTSWLKFVFTMPSLNAKHPVPNIIYFRFGVFTHVFTYRHIHCVIYSYWQIEFTSSNSFPHTLTCPLVTPPIPAIPNPSARMA